MVKRPKVSIIIPIYNVEDYLSRCLESVMNQTLSDIEIIGVNDGTKDNSVEIMRRYMALDSRMQLVEKENGGLSSARNAGLAVATGDMILFLDSDDYLALNACERIYEERLNHGADIIVFGSTPFPEVPEPDPWVIWALTCRDVYYPKFHPDALFKEPSGNPFAWNRAFSRKFLVRNHLTFSEDVLFGEDLVFIFQAAPLAKGIQFISDKLHYYQCFRQGSLMNKYNGENERKLCQHVRNMRFITDFWYKKGFLKKWSRPYTAWFIRFIGSDLVVDRPANARQLINEVIKIMDDYHMTGGRMKIKALQAFCKVIG